MEVEMGDDVPCSSMAVDSVIRMGTAGLIWGSCSAPYDANKLGVAGIHRASFIAKSVARFGFQWGMFAAIFSSTRCGLQRYRRQNDWVNVLTAGVVAGAAFGAGTRNWKQVAGATGMDQMSETTSHMVVLGWSVVIGWIPIRIWPTKI